MAQIQEFGGKFSLDALFGSFQNKGFGEIFFGGGAKKSRGDDI
jgi:hypothetical protein